MEYIYIVIVKGYFNYWHSIVATQIIFSTQGILLKVEEIIWHIWFKKILNGRFLISFP